MKVNIKSIENALNKKLAQVPLKGAWLRLHQEYGVGLPQGMKLALSSDDYEKLIDIVELETGVNLRATSVSDFKEMQREQVLTLAHDEKMSGKKVKADRLALKTLSQQPLLINQASYQIPAVGHSDINIEQIESVEHNCLLIVENYRCFDQIQQIKLALPAQYRNPLVLYRGDKEYSEKTLHTLLRQCSLPVIAMMDIDLKSLLIAHSLEQVIGLMCMPLMALDSALHQSGNAALYAKQLPSNYQALSNIDEPVLNDIVDLLSKHQKVWVQEHDLAAQYSLDLMLFSQALKPN